MIIRLDYHHPPSKSTSSFHRQSNNCAAKSRRMKSSTIICFQSDVQRANDDCHRKTLFSWHVFVLAHIETCRYVYLPKETFARGKIPKSSRVFLLSTFLRYVSCRFVSEEMNRYYYLWLIVVLSCIFILKSSFAESISHRSKRFLFSSSCRRKSRPCEYHYDCCPGLRCSPFDSTCQIYQWSPDGKTTKFPILFVFCLCARLADVMRIMIEWIDHE